MFILTERKKMLFILNKLCLFDEFFDVKKTQNKLICLFSI